MAALDAATELGAAAEPEAGTELGAAADPDAPPDPEAAGLAQARLCAKMSDVIRLNVFISMTFVGA